MLSTDRFTKPQAPRPKGPPRTGGGFNDRGRGGQRGGFGDRGRGGFGGDRGRGGFNRGAPRGRGSFGGR